MTSPCIRSRRLLRAEIDVVDGWVTRGGRAREGDLAERERRKTMTVVDVSGHASVVDEIPDELTASVLEHHGVGSFENGFMSRIIFSI